LIYDAPFGACIVFFSVADAFPDEIQLFKNFIQAINRNEADTISPGTSQSQSLEKIAPINHWQHFYPSSSQGTPKTQAIDRVSLLRAAASSKQDPAFRFSLRNNFATDGLSGLFIGTIGKITLPPPYFCFTLWYRAPHFRPLRSWRPCLDLHAVEWNKDQQSVAGAAVPSLPKPPPAPQNAGSPAP
jgi:hypothetical protein